MLRLALINYGLFKAKLLLNVSAHELAHSVIKVLKFLVSLKKILAFFLRQNAKLTLIICFLGVILGDFDCNTHSQRCL